MEGRAFTGFAFCGNETAIVLHDLFHDGQADARAGVLASAVQPVEHLEYFFGILFVEPDTVIAYGDVVKPGGRAKFFALDLVAVDDGILNGDPRITVGQLVLDTVTDEVFKQLLELEPHAF